jgi:hypothetical protein
VEEAVVSLVEEVVGGISGSSFTVGLPLGSIRIVSSPGGGGMMPPMMTAMGKSTRPLKPEVQGGLPDVVLGGQDLQTDAVCEGPQYQRGTTVGVP